MVNSALDVRQRREQKIKPRGKPRGLCDGWEHGSSLGRISGAPWIKRFPTL
jgi:hypothetical protein